MRRSPEARRPVTPGIASRVCFFVDNSFLCCLLCTVWLLVCPAPAFAQAAPQPAPSPAPQSEIKQDSAEIATHDEPTTFKVNVRLVVVRAVVRDSQGHAVGNLRQEDFQVFDKGKPQVITQFEVEQPGTIAAKARQKAVENSGDIPSSDAPPNPVNATPGPERFVAYMFDDVHLEFGDLARVREAAERHFATLRPTDRAAIFTTSGRTTLDFTDDRNKLHQAVVSLQPHPISHGFEGDCPRISYYQADLIINRRDPEAGQVALQEATDCAPKDLQGRPVGNPEATVSSVSAEVFNAGEQESRIALGSLKDVIHIVSRKPGQRSVVFASPGFIAPQLEYEYIDIIDHAVRSQIAINTLDARGLYAILPFGDVSQQSTHAPPPGKALIESAAASANDDLLQVLADGTGGTFFHNNNDFDQGFRRVAETPEYSYMLAFVPQNLKLDGSFHSLKVTVKNQQKLTLQARRGYYAPKNFGNPDEQAKQEIEDAMYSQEELHNLPVNLHTQFFKASDQDAELVVVAHVDVKRLHFRKAEGRNNNVLTCAFALFNRNGNLVQGTETIATMHLKDATLERKKDSGITLKTSFDVKPGSYLVRLVVRDAEGQMMSAENGTVEIR